MADYAKYVILFVAILLATLVCIWVVRSSQPVDTIPPVRPELAVSSSSASTSSAAPSNAKKISCPVVQPSSLPFTDTTDTDKQLNELRSLALRQPNKSEADALRWTIWQPKFNETVRNEAVKVLLAGNPDWLVSDLLQLTQDPTQSSKWRGWCVQYLEKHYRDHRDKESVDGMFAAATRDDPAPAVQAIFSVSVLSRDLEWKRTDPIHSNEFQKVIGEMLPKLQPPDPKDAQVKDKNAIAEALLDAASQGDFRELAPSIEQIAGDEKWNVGVRVAAVKSLMMIGRKESLPVLRKCITETDHPLLVKFGTMAVAGLEKQ